MDFNVLEFKFMGTPPWTFPPAHIYLFLLKWVKASHSPSELCCSALGQSLVRVWAVPVFPDFEVFISSFRCFDLYSGIICYFPQPFSQILFQDSSNFILYSDSWSACWPLGAFITLSSENVSFVIFMPIKNLSSPGSPPTLGSLAMKIWCIGQNSHSFIPSQS